MEDTARKEVIRQLFAELEAEGKIARTGEVRNGEPVYIMTTYGKQELAKETQMLN